MVRLLALLVFLSCSLSAFCLGMLAFTFVTGDLPMGIQPIIRDKPLKKKIPERKELKAGPGAEARLEEKFLSGFYDELVKEKEKLAEERKNLTTRKKVVDEIKDEALKMQNEIGKSEIRVKSLLDVIDKKEVENVKKITSLMSGMDLAQSSKMLMEMDEAMAARVLYFMNQKMASQLISQVMQTATEEQAKRIKKVTDRIQILTEEYRNE